MSNVLELRELDSNVWVPGAVKAMFKMGIPHACKDPIWHENGVLYYNSVYYYSTKSTRPHVCLVRILGFPYPLVRCCNIEQYERFLEQYVNREFNAYDLKIQIPETLVD